MDRFTFSICIAAPESGALTVEDDGATAVQRRQVCSRRTFQRLSPNLQQLTSCSCMRHIEKSMKIIIIVIVIFLMSVYVRMR